jgi:hypothetical protein
MAGILRILFLGATIALLATAGTSPAQAGPWTVPSGAGDHFTYSNGRDLQGRFGEPTVTDGTFSFPQISFGVSASGGSSASLTDTVSFDVQALSGWRFGQVRVVALGSYAVSGSPSANSANVDAMFTVTENTGLIRQWQGIWAPNPDMPVTGGSGSWSGLDVLDLTWPDPLPSTSLHIELRHDLLAVSGISGSAVINLLTGGSGLTIGITTVEVPEPSALVLLLLGGWTVCQRRR